MDATEKIIELRALLAGKFPKSAFKAASRFPSGLRSLDEPLEGGLPQGAITEITSTHGGGLLLLALLEASRRANAFLALIDGCDSFDAAGLPEPTLSRLLWVRCRTGEEAIRAADLILRDGNLPLAILDLRSNPSAQLRKIPLTTWYRLQRVVEPVSTALVVLTRHSIVSSAQVKVTVDAPFSIDAFDRRRTVLTAELAVAFPDSARAGLRQFA